MNNINTFLDTYFSVEIQKLLTYDTTLDYSAAVKACIEKLSNNNVQRYYEYYQQLPCIESSSTCIKEGCVIISTNHHNAYSKIITPDLFVPFKPWRKGPFQFDETFIDTEWCSYLKWDRLKSHIDLKDKVVGDIGCGSGYHLFQMWNKEAKLCVGIDSFELFFFQYLTVQHFAQINTISFLPGKYQEFLYLNSFFDTLFCMGVLYHHKDPIMCLNELKQFIKKDGDLILETLVLDQEGEGCLIPKGRYASMRNVYSIPTLTTLMDWTKQAGFSQVTCIDVSKTTPIEQRSTDWTFDFSLINQLNPLNPQLTIEGYPAPTRAILKMCL